MDDHLACQRGGSDCEGRAPRIFAAACFAKVGANGPATPLSDRIYHRVHGGHGGKQSRDWVVRRLTQREVRI